MKESFFPKKKIVFVTLPDPAVSVLINMTSYANMYDVRSVQNLLHF